MLKLKLKHTNLPDFPSSSLFCLENNKFWKSDKAETRIDTKIIRV